MLSQSGNLAIELDRLLSARGLGISRFVSLGNQADVSLVELIEACAADPATVGDRRLRRGLPRRSRIRRGGRRGGRRRDAGRIARRRCERRRRPRRPIPYRLADQRCRRDRRGLRGRRSDPGADPAPARRRAAGPAGEDTVARTAGRGADRRWRPWRDRVRRRRGRRARGARAVGGDASPPAGCALVAVPGRQPRRPGRRGRDGPGQLCPRIRGAAGAATRSTRS